MSVPTWAGFVADFPDDQVESGGDIQVFGGRNVAVALGEILASLGCTRVSAPKAAGEMGWEFAAYYQDRYPIFCRLQSFHPVFWLLFEDSSASKKGAVAYVALWRKLGNALEQDPRFHKILWRSRKDGPPDWDEVEAADDRPERTFDEEFPAADLHTDPPKPGCWSSIAGILLAWLGFWATYNALFIAAPEDRSSMMAVGLVMLLPGSWLILRPRIHRGDR